jgi:oxygen-dependent protoporphyrinogen oxidase
MVVVIGGGISGLTAARKLKAGGLEVTLIEQSPRLGGKVMTDHIDGFLIEAGPDSFVAGKGSVLALAGELGIRDQVISVRDEAGGAFVWHQGRFHPLPQGLLLMAPSRLGPLLSSSLLSWKGKLRALADLVLPRPKEEIEGSDARWDESLESFVVRRLGREVLERIAGPLIAGIHAAEPSTMSLRASFPRFLQMEREHRSLILAARAAARPRVGREAGPAPGLSHFASFKRGMGTLSEALVASLVGIDVKVETTVTRLSGEPGGGYRLTLGEGDHLLADAVVMAIPAANAAALLVDLAPEAAVAIAQIRQVATASVTLAYHSNEIPSLDGTGFVVPSIVGRRIIGASYLSRKWEGRVPGPDTVLVRAFVGGPNGQDLARSSEERIVQVVRDELSVLVGIKAEPLLTMTRLWESGLHQYTLGHLDRVAKAETELAQLRGLALAGAAFHGIGLNECVTSGHRAADIVLQSMQRQKANCDGAKVISQEVSAQRGGSH